MLETLQVRESEVGEQPALRVFALPFCASARGGAPTLGLNTPKATASSAPRADRSAAVPHPHIGASTAQAQGQLALLSAGPAQRPGRTTPFPEDRSRLKELTGEGHRRGVFVVNKLKTPKQNRGFVLR